MAKHHCVNYPASIMISGVESDRYFDIVVRQGGFRFVLMSYHYLQKRAGDFLVERVKEFPDLRIFIDSGTYTFLTKYEEYVDKPMEFWEDYIQKYTEWVIEHKDQIYACANLDIEDIVGVEKVDEWDEKYFKKVEEAGVEVCYIWHTPRGETGWEEMCKKHSYIGMSMENDKTMTTQRLMKRLKVAEKYNTRVHGMALTKTEILVRVPFYSADSSVTGDSKVLVRDKGIEYETTIEELYNQNIQEEFRTTDYETRVPYDGLQVLTVDNSNQVIWGDLYGVVKHKVNKPLVKLTTSNGREVTCTTDHSIIILDEIGKLKEVEADKLKVGDKLIVNLNPEDEKIEQEEIERIEEVSRDKEVEVYDLSVREYERFFANDILVHNTTWLVGQQYGELNWFNGRKMQRLSKDKWQRQYKTQLLKEPFNADWERLMTGMGGQGDTYELLRLNIIAYEQAEEHIRKRLANKMYWLPKEGESVPEEFIKLPEKEWFKGDMEEWKSFLEGLRIDPSTFTKEEAISTLAMMYGYKEEDYEFLSEIFADADLIAYAQIVISESITTIEETHEKLGEYMLANMTGERKDFQTEESMDLEVEKAKEREDYIIEDEFEIIDLDKEEIEGIQKCLPSDLAKDMPEVEAYDEELKERGIEVVRDEQGRFLKGQTRVKKPKDVYSEKYPKLSCDTCYKSGDCPEYSPGYVCAFDKMFRRYDTRNSDDVMEAMSSIVNMNLGRLQKAMLFETMDGGMATPEVTGLIDQNVRLMEKLTQLKDHRADTILKQRRIRNADGSETVDTSMSVNPQSGGILSQIFGGGGGAPSVPDKEDEDVIEVEAVERKRSDK